MGRLNKSVPKQHRFVIFHSIRHKLLVLMIALSLLPLAGMSLFSYLVGRNQIQARIRLSLGKMAQDTADKVDLLLRGKKEEIHLMATTFPLIYHELNKNYRREIIPLLNNYCFQQDVYDLLIVLDISGEIIGINTTDRNRAPLPGEKISEILERNSSTTARFSSICFFSGPRISPARSMHRAAMRSMRAPAGRSCAAPL